MKRALAIVALLFVPALETTARAQEDAGLQMPATHTLTVSVAGTAGGEVYVSGYPDSGTCLPGQTCAYLQEEGSIAYVSATLHDAESSLSFTGCSGSVMETWGECSVMVLDDVAITVTMSAPVPPDPALVFRAGAPKDWEDLGMWDPRGDVGISPSGNVQQRIPLFGWTTPGAGGAIAVALFHNSAEADVQRGAGWGFRVGVAATLAVDTDGTVTITEPDGTPRAFEPVAGGFVAEPRDAGRLSISGDTYLLDERHGNVRRFTRPNGLGHVETSRTDRLGLSTTFSYDALDRITAVSDSSGRSATFTVSGGTYVSFTGPSGTTVTPVYDGGELRNLQGPTAEGATPNLALSYEVDGQRHLIASRTTWAGGSAASPVTRYSYYPGGAVRTVEHADGTIHRIDYDDGRVTLSDSLGRTSSLIFWHGAVIAGVTPTGRTVYIARDQQNRPVLMIDAEGRLRRWEWNALHRIVRSWDALGRATTYAHDTRGNVTATTTPDDLTWTRVYNAFDQITSATDPRGQTTSYEHDAVGNLLRVIDATGHTVSSAAYDANGRPISTTDGYGRTTTISYDAHGNWTQRIGPAGTRSRVLADSFGRVASETNELGETTTYAYDGFGRQRSTTYATGGTVTRTLDLDGRLTGLVDARGPKPQATSLSYTPTHSVATRSVNGNSVQTAPAQITMNQPEPVEVECTPTCSNRCGADLPDSCGGEIDCVCSSGLVCSGTGYCVLP